MLRGSVLVLQLTLGLAIASPVLPGYQRAAEGSVGPRHHGGLSSLTFGWLHPTLRLGATRPLQLADLPELDHAATTGACADGFDVEWAVIDRPPAGWRPLNVSTVAIALWNGHGKAFAWAGALKLACDICQIASPLLLKHTISLLEQGVGLSQGVRAVAMLLMLTVTQAFTLRHYFASVFRTGLSLRAAVVGATYRKLLRLSPASRLRASSGEIQNLMGSDAQRIADLTPYLHALWFAPLQVTAALAILGRELGWATVPGLAVILLMLRLNKSIAAATFRVQQKLLRARDERARLTRELLGGIKAIKLNAWEAPFGGRVEAAREAELELMGKLVELRSLLSALFSCTPTLVAVVMLGSSTALYKMPLTLKTAMTVLATVNLLRSPLVFLPLVLQSLQEASLSLGRMERFLKLPESTNIATGQLTDTGVLISDATFEWPAAPGRAITEGSDAMRAHLPDEPISSAGEGEHTQGSDLGVAVAEDVPTGDATAFRDGSPVAAVDAPTRGGFELHGICLSASKGELVGIVGPVGAGKSSLLSALLGDIPTTKGSVSVRGSIAYAAQTPFILGASVRDNILFGAPYDAERFARVVEACQLLPDLKQLRYGELTPIGDKGVALSGGQRARVALARAVYSDAQVYLLDDPLSACDPAVAARLMEKVLGPNGILKDRLRILVSSALEPLSVADSIYVLDNGAVAEFGTFGQLEAAGGQFSRQLQLSREQMAGASALAASPSPLQPSAEPQPTAPTSHGGYGDLDTQSSDQGEVASPNHAVLSSDSAERAAASCEVMTDAATGSTASGNEVEQSTDSTGASNVATDVDAPSDTSDDDSDFRVTGRVKMQTLFRWLSAAGGARAVLLAIIPLAAAEIVSLGSSWWLTRWAGAPPSAQIAYLAGFAGWAFASAVLVVLRSRLMLGLGLTAGRVIHEDLLARILGAPLAFFDTTPRGRVLSRFSREMLTVDVSLPSSLQTYLSTLASVCSTVCVVLASSPLFGAILLPITLAYVAVQRFYSTSSRELKRIEAATRAPLLSHVASSLDGLPTIRAFDARRRFAMQCEAALDDNLRASLTSSLVNCWLGLRLELLGAIISAAAAALAFARNAAAGSGIMNAGLRGAGGVGTAALGVTLALQVTQTLNWSVRQACEVEAHLISVERLRSYQSLEPEPGWTPLQLQMVSGRDTVHVETESGAKSAPGPNTSPSADRVGASELVLRNLSLRYREGLPLVLKGISATVAPGEKVGVVGRTGSGKSSLVQAITRLVAPPLRSGAIELDGMDISNGPLLAHRESVAVIPQEPVLFSGTVRDNLDPKGAWPDEALWEALRRVQMAHAVRSLNEEVSEDGANYSSGQRQLLCIARALLSRCRLVILDEATSSVDAETDALIQRTVRSAFRHATVLTIAHRLNSVLDADKIMVLDAGELVEFGSPQELMSKQGGRFRQLVNAAS